MARTKGVPGQALGLAAAGGILIYAGVADKSPIVALRELVKGRASGPAPFVRPSASSTERFGTGSVSGATGGTEFGRQAAAIAAQQVGKRYVRGGKGPEVFDCSGLVFYSYQQAGASEYRYLTSYGIAASPKFTKINRADVGAGDILWKTGHVAIAISNTELVEAFSSRSPVRRTNIPEGRFTIFLRYAPARVSTGRAR